MPTLLLTWFLNSLRRSACLACVFAGLALTTSPHSSAAAQPPTTAISSADAARATKAIMAARLAEPLIRTAPTSAAEDLALAQVLAPHAGLGDKSNDFADLQNFLKKYPHSGWAPALLANLGISYLHDGYFSRAIDAWRKAWTQGKNATDPRARALVDRAVGELAWLYAALGQTKNLSALFVEIGNRPISGSATELVQTAAEDLALVKKDPRELFNCGPVALSSLMLALGADFGQVKFLQFYRAGPNGTSLAEVAKLADQAKFSYRLVFRKPGQPVPVPSIVHWKLGHFAAIVGKANGHYHVADPEFPGSGLWVTPGAIDSEASGYFLVPAAASHGAGWRSVSVAEAGRLWGKGSTIETRIGDAGDPPADGPPPPTVLRGEGPPPGTNTNGNNGNNNNNNDCKTCSCGGMCGYNIKESSVSVTLSDTPVGYEPPIGPSAKVQITYNQREDSQPANFNFFNVSPKWTLNWLSYVTDDPNNPGANVSRYLAGGGAFYYTGYNSATGQFAAQDTDGSVLVLTSQTPITYQRNLGDGSIEIYAQSDGSVSFPRRIFLSEVIDPQGNTLTLNYDSQERLVSLTDATGRQTTFTYGISVRPLLVTQITDPFGRSASLAYDSSGRLISITDVIGLISSFTYDANSLVNSMTTPYGTTNFSYTAPGTSAPPRFVQVTDPLGYNEREEWLEPAPIPASDPAATLPQGMSVANEFLEYRDSFHWDKNAYTLAGCTPTGGCDYTKARDRHFTHQGSGPVKSTTIESVQYALENRIWYGYPGQSSPLINGTGQQASVVGRVLDDGTTQLSQYSYDTGGYFKLTQSVDPLGRTTSYAYSNHVDLAAISQTTAFGIQELIAQFIYNTHHRPVFYTDAAGQTTTYTYNAAGQLTSVTNPLGQTTSFQYDTQSNLSAIINANNVTAASFTYDAFDRIATYTDSEGWTVGFSYDNADRITKITYPDGTSDTYTYDKLDLASYRDREGRTWTYTHDANRRLTSVTDPLENQTLYGYNPIGELTSLQDPRGNITSWSYDVEGRLIGKEYADTSTLADAYENTTSRLKSVTDALGQVKQYSYAKDDRLTGIAYSNAVNPTPNVSFAYDPFFPRLASMTDGTGTTQYSYGDVGAVGALKLQQETGPLSDSAITYAYDVLGRLISRTVAGAGAETFQYDAIGRAITHATDLGSFTLSYLGQTRQMTSRQLASSTLATSWGYLPNTGDRRLASISNVGLVAGQHSTYQYTTTPEDFISAIAETSDAAPVYPSPGTQTASYNNLNQLTNLSGQTLTWDPNGNLLSDGLRDYSWDAENRLIGIAYPSQPGKATSFAYDGLGRRTSISSTPAGGGSAVTLSYLWCGSRICQARDSNNTVTREYYSEGELVPGTPAQTYFYGPDQIGSVRRVFESATSAPAYSYDPYGNALQATAPATDFNYAGMFYNADSGLYLTQYRAYDPVAGRWLSRDPVGEGTDPNANLYSYVGGNPLSYADPLGLQTIPDPNGVVPGGPWSSAGPGQPSGTFYGPPQGGGRSMCRWVPPEDQGGPPGSQGYWKSKEPFTPWSRFDQNGNPVTPDEAHPNPLPANPIPPLVRLPPGLGLFLSVLLYSPPAY